MQNVGIQQLQVYQVNINCFETIQKGIKNVKNDIKNDIKNIKNDICTKTCYQQGCK